MEDVFSVAYQQTEDEKDLEYAYFGIFDGHGGREAAAYAKEHLMDHIVRQKGFWSEDDDDILRSIHEGFLSTHHAMWKELGKNFLFLGYCFSFMYLKTKGFFKVSLRMSLTVKL